MQALRIILFPLSILYGLILTLRNKCYDWNWLKTTKFENQFIINVGNLAVGGTGKTPHVEYLVKLLKDSNIAILSRGYGRKSNGVILADDSSNATQIGDEPSQYNKKFGKNSKVCVAENRVDGAKYLIKNVSKLNTIILDDAFQHRAIDRDLNLLLTDYNNLFYNDYLLPTGNLRETRAGAERADAIIITKCPSELSLNKIEKIEIHCKYYSNSPIFFSKVVYGNLIPLNNTFKLTEEIILLTGLANDKPIFKYVNENYQLKKHIKKADHYAYTQSDIADLESKYNDFSIITTEKDAVKLEALNLEKVNISYLPIEVEFIGKEFDNFVLSKLNE